MLFMHARYNPVVAHTDPLLFGLTITKDAEPEGST